METSVNEIWTAFYAITIWMIIGVVPADAQTRGPSFDCSTALRADEMTICGDVGLSALDRTANAGYVEIKRQSGPQVANQMGRKFLTLRSACQSDKLCLFRQYAAIIRAYREAGSTIEFPTWAFGGHLPDPTAVQPKPDQPKVELSPPSTAPINTTQPIVLPPITPSSTANQSPLIAPRPEPIPTNNSNITSTANQSGGSGALWLLLLPAGALFAYRLYILHRKSECRRALNLIIASQATIYAKNRSQKVYKDDYGILVTKEWDKHKKYIVETVLVKNLLQEGFSTSEISATVNDQARVQNLIELAALGASACSENLDISNVGTGVDYERHCAAILNAAGWTTKLTRGSGDQGVDILANRNGWRVVLQCKFYHGQPVGNKAVQEVISARLYERAKAAAVVSNASFTRSARQLANSGKVLLLHHDELSSLEQRLGASQGEINAVS